MKASLTHDNSSRPIVTYIATNERNVSVLNSLSRAGFFLIKDVEDTLNRLGAREKLNILDQFIVELQLVCDSQFFFAFGSSWMHEFAKRCRNGANRELGTVIIK
jgi:hypothetical protein